MSLVLKTVRAFPRGRTTEELLVLVGASFSHDKRLAAVAELDQLMRDGLVEKARDGRWRARRAEPGKTNQNQPPSDARTGPIEEGVIHASSATFEAGSVAGTRFYSDDVESTAPDPQALLRYWRSALRA